MRYLKSLAATLIALAGLTVATAQDRTNDRLPPVGERRSETIAPAPTPRDGSTQNRDTNAAASSDRPGSIALQAAPSGQASEPVFDRFGRQIGWVSRDSIQPATGGSSVGTASGTSSINYGSFYGGYDNNLAPAPGGAPVGGPAMGGCAGGSCAGGGCAMSSCGGGHGGCRLGGLLGGGRRGGRGCR
jgi:hypothetical protein